MHGFERCVVSAGAAVQLSGGKRNEREYSISSVLVFHGECRFALLIFMLRFVIEVGMFNYFAMQLTGGRTLTFNVSMQSIMPNDDQLTLEIPGSYSAIASWGEFSPDDSFNTFSTTISSLSLRYYSSYYSSSYNFANWYE
jgi:hypothetical protein